MRIDVYPFIRDHVHVIILARKWGLKYRGFGDTDFVDVAVLTVVCETLPNSQCIERLDVRTVGFVAAPCCCQERETRLPCTRAIQLF